MNSKIKCLVERYSNNTIDQLLIPVAKGNGKNHESSIKSDHPSKISKELDAQTCSHSTWQILEMFTIDTVC